jgi:predicted MFS family arabinose efflux permease
MTAAATSSPAGAADATAPRHWIWPVLAGVCAMFVGLGLGRFAYTPLIPPLVTDGWFSGADAAYLGAANLAGYMVGALVGHRFAGRIEVPVLRGMMLLTALSFAACAIPLSFAWFFGWRFAAGVAGAIIMVLAAPRVLSAVPPHRLGLAGGLIFAGVGLGIAASGTLVPALIGLGLEAAWLALGGLAVVLTAISWPFWPRLAPPPVAPAAPARVDRRRLCLILAYGLVAAALVPHMVFLVDYVARGLGRGLEVGAFFWVLFGAGAVLGPVVAGRIADLVGFATAMRGGLAILAASIAWLALTGDTAALVVTALYAGAAVPGFTSLALGRLRALLPADTSPAQVRATWGRATLSFAVMQAAAGYACSALFDITGDYGLLFAAGAAAAALALIVDLAGRETRPLSA